jgi:hypothetical protein
VLCYEHLDLKTPPVAPKFKLPESLRTASLKFRCYEPEAILSAEIQRDLASLKLAAGSVVLFYKRPGTVGYLHSDLTLTNDRWVKWTCSINWTLVGGPALMSWYDCQKLEEFWPPDEELANYSTLNAVYYGGRFNRDIRPSDIRLIESTRINGPTLVNTQLPHQIIVDDSEEKGRWCLSLRFAPDFATWEDAVSALKPWIRRQPAA